MQLHQGNLFWDETIHKADYLELDSSFSTDVLVIGGGMSGALISHQLSQDGIDVTVIDERVPGYGSSDGNTGIIQYNSDKSLVEMIKDFGKQHAVDFYQFSIQAMKRLGEIVNDLSEEVGYQSTHSLFLATSEDAIESLKNNADTLTTYGFPAQFIDKKSLFSEYNLHAYGAIRTGSDAELNPVKMVQALHRENLRKGTAVYQHAQMTSIVEDGDGFIVQVNEQTIQAKKVILAMGYAKHAYPVIETALQRNTTFSLVTQVIDEKLWGQEEMIWDDQDPYIYFRKTEDHRIIAGGRDQRGSQLGDETTIQKETDRIYQKIKQYYPSLNTQIIRRWQSVFGESKDGIPFIGQDNKNPNLYYAFGYGGNGTCYSVMASMIIEAYMKGKEHPLAYTTKYPRIKKDKQF